MGTPFLHKLGQKIIIFGGFSKNFSGRVLTGFQIKFLILIEFPSHYILIDWKTAKKKIKSGVVLGRSLGQIMSNVVKKVKKQAISLGFFFIFYLGNTF